MVGRLLIAFSFLTALMVCVSVVRADSDPLVGCWKMKKLYGSFSYTIRAYDSGRAVNEMLGNPAKGKWKRHEDGTYTITPSGEDDYYRIEGGELQSYDNEGLIRTLGKVTCK